MTPPDLVGYVGVALCLLAYALLQTGKVAPTAPAYSALNGFGAIGILISLWFDPNLPAIVMEGLWLLISLFGLYQALKPKKA